MPSTEAELTTDLKGLAFAAADAQLDEYGKPLTDDGLRVALAMMWLAGRGDGLLEGDRIATAAFKGLAERLS